MEVKVGDRYGRLTVIADLPGYPRKVRCKCDCGSVVDKWLSNLRNTGSRGKDTGCGCVRREITVARNTSHGLSGSPEFKVWCGMRKRCLNPKAKSYSDYGGRGIVICKRWGSFKVFMDDMGKRPGPEYSIERLDPNGNYCKKNCKWATKRDQNRNTRVSRRVTLGGITKCVCEWNSLFPGFKAAFYRYGVEKAASIVRDRS